MQEMAEVVIGAGQTLAERLAAARVEAGIALWALPYGADWEAAWRACPRPDWVVEMYMLGGRITPGSEEHKAVLRALRAELSPEQIASTGRDEERLLVDLVDAWLRGDASTTLISTTLDLLRDERRLVLQLALPEDQLFATEAIYLLAESVQDPVSPSLCARALACAAGKGVYDRDLAARLAAALPCPESLKTQPGDLS